MLCECTQNVWKMQKSNKKTATTAWNCQIYDITHIHDRRNNNEPSRYTHSMYLWEFYLIFSSLFQQSTYNNGCVREYGAQI